MWFLILLGLGIGGAVALELFMAKQVQGGSGSAEPGAPFVLMTIPPGASPTDSSSWVRFSGSFQHLAAAQGMGQRLLSQGNAMGFVILNDSGAVVASSLGGQ